MHPEYTFKGTATFDEYLECHRIMAAKRRAWLRSLIFIYGVGMILFGFLSGGASPDMTFILIGVGFVVHVILISPILFRYRVRRNWHRYPRVKKEFEVVISASGVTTMDDLGNPSHSNWESFTHFRESPSLFLLYVSPLLPFCLPKRFISSNDHVGVRELLCSSLASSNKGDKPHDN